MAYSKLKLISPVELAELPDEGSLGPDFDKLSLEEKVRSIRFVLSFSTSFDFLVLP
jgi:hypothetical protein